MIRPVRQQDAAIVATMWRELLNVPNTTDEVAARTIQRMEEDDHYGTYVAVEDGRVVGFITFVEVISFDDPDGYIKMNGIAVLPEYQRRGIARQLVERVEEEARKRGASSVGCATSFGREGSQALLKKLGYEKSAFWFHKIF